MSFVNPEVFKLKIEIQRLTTELERYKKECHDIDLEQDFCVVCEAERLRDEINDDEEIIKTLRAALVEARLVIGLPATAEMANAVIKKIDALLNPATAGE